MLFSLVVFQFSCSSDLFAKSDRTATDCCVKNVSFLCLSTEFFMDHGRTLIFFCDRMAPNMRETKTYSRIKGKLLDMRFFNQSESF